MDEHGVIKHISNKHFVFEKLLTVMLYLSFLSVFLILHFICYHALSIHQSYPSIYSSVIPDSSSSSSSSVSCNGSIYCIASLPHAYRSLKDLHFNLLSIRPQRQFSLLNIDHRLVLLQKVQSKQTSASLRLSGHHCLSSLLSLLPIALVAKYSPSMHTSNAFNAPSVVDMPTPSSIG